MITVISLKYFIKILISLQYQDNQQAICLKNKKEPTLTDKPCDLPVFPLACDLACDLLI